MDVQTYYMRARDSGTVGWVYWLTTIPDTPPTPVMTMPNFTGALSSTMVVYSYRTSVDVANGFIIITGGTADTFGNGWRVGRSIVGLNIRVAYDTSDMLVFSGSQVRVV